MSQGWKLKGNKTSLACLLNGHMLCGSNCRRKPSICGPDRGHCYTCKEEAEWIKDGDFIPIEYVAHNKDGTLR